MCPYYIIYTCFAIASDLSTWPKQYRISCRGLLLVLRNRYTSLSLSRSNVSRYCRCWSAGRPRERISPTISFRPPALSPKHHRRRNVVNAHDRLTRSRSGSVFVFRTRTHERNRFFDSFAVLGLCVRHISHSEPRVARSSSSPSVGMRPVRAYTYSTYVRSRR